MRLSGMLLGGLVLWTAAGAAGTAVRAARGERRRATRGMWWIAGVWGIYLGVLLGASRLEPQRTIAMGDEQCFDTMCFRVDGVDEVEGFEARGQVRERLVRVRVRVTNRAGVSSVTGWTERETRGEARLGSYVVDGGGRRWEEVRGLSGVRLTTRVAPGGSIVSAPVFQVPRDATSLGLVLTHGGWQPGVLEIGDPDSWGHRPTVMSMRAAR